MKILQTIYQFQTGGGALQVVADLASAARTSGHSVTILARDTPVSSSVGAERFFTGNKILDGWFLSQHLSKEQYDIVHVHDRYCSLLMSLIPQSPPCVQTNHIAYQTHRRLTRFADYVVGCSRSMDQHHADFFKLPASRRVLIPNGVFCRVPDASRAQLLRQSLPQTLQQRQICLTVARLTTQKGHDSLLKAIASLPPSLRQAWGFILAGSGELEPQLRAQAEQLGIAFDLLFLGQTSDVPEWLSLADAFVLPSLYEGLPLALLEAMAAGLACLASAVDGNLEVLRHGENGLLCPPADPQGLSQTLEALLSDEVLRTRLAQQAQADYWSHWTFERTWQQYEALYTKLSQRSKKSVQPNAPVLAQPTSLQPMTASKFSVVIPAYNVSLYIADCLNSVLAQSETDFEVLVVDDGSTDDTAQIVSTFEDPRVRLIQRPNGGLAAARNTGIRAAQGDLVAFLDADDRWCPGKLAAHRQVLEADPQISVSYDQSAFIDVHGQRNGLKMARTRAALTHEVLLLKNYLGNGSTAVVRRSILEQVGGFDEDLRRFVDHELWVRLTFQGHRFQFIPHVLTEYRVHASSFTADTERMLKSLEAFLAKIATYAPQSVQRLAPLTLACTHRWMARAAFVDGDYAKARLHAVQALRTTPQVLWRDPRAPITFAAIAVQVIAPEPLFQGLLQLGRRQARHWLAFRSRSRSLRQDINGS